MPAPRPRNAHCSRPSRPATKPQPWPGSRITGGGTRKARSFARPSTAIKSAHAFRTPTRAASCGRLVEPARHRGLGCLRELYRAARERRGIDHVLLFHAEGADGPFGSGRLFLSGSRRCRARADDRGLAGHRAPGGPRLRVQPNGSATASERLSGRRKSAAKNSIAPNTARTAKMPRQDTMRAA